MRGYGWEFMVGKLCRRWQRRRLGESSGVSGADVGPLRSGRATLRAIHYRGESGVAAVLLALSMTYDGRCSSAPVTSWWVERCTASLAIR